MFKRIRLGIVGLLALGVLAITTMASTFDGAPPAPLPYTQGSFLDGWDVQIHDREDQTHPGTIPAMVAEHGADCSAPPATHVTSGNPDDAVFQCANHFMTAIDGDTTGYSAIYLTPPEMVDFTNGEAVVRWDMSTERDSTRDWIDLRITPFTENVARPLQDWFPDLNGEPAHSIEIKMDSFSGATDFSIIDVNGNGVGAYWWETIDPATTSATVRETFELRISQNYLKFWMPGRNLVWYDGPINNPGFTTGIVQFGQHSYTPSKDNSGTPATWHWDNVSISPSIPFSIQRIPGYTTGGTVNFAPAPAGAYLRFAAIGKVKVNGVSVNPQIPTLHAEHFNSYFVPIPEGSTSATITLSADGWYTGPYLAEGLAVWSLNSSPSTPTPTSSPSSPTATPTTAATNTPLPTATATSTPAATNTPTATPTPQLFECRTRDQRQTRPVGSTTWSTANDPWSTVTIVSSRAECVGD